MTGEYMGRIKELLYLLFAALGIMSVAFYNGYPLIMPDTGTYIDTAFNFSMPPDRPPFYGMFLRITSLSLSLWFPVFAQSALLAFLLYRLSSLVYGAGAPRRFYVLCFIIITSFTYVSWVSSFLMADSFTPILFLSILLFLYRDVGTARAAAYLPLIAIAALMHNSHFVIAILCAVCLMAAAAVQKSKMLGIKSLALLVTSLLCCLLTCCMNLAVHKEFTLSSGSHVFMMGKLGETGVLNAYLGDCCPTERYQLCKYQDEIPIDAADFVWSGKSPFHKTGGWDSSKQEYSAIIHDVFTTPKYFAMFAVKSVISTIRQTAQITFPGKPPVQGIGTGAFIGINHYYHHELKEYLSSKQNGDYINLDPLNILYGLFFIMSSVFVLCLLPGMQGHKQITALYGTLILLIVLNAFVTATFGNVLDRLQNRVFWLLPAMNAIVVARYLYDKVSVRNGGD